MAGFYLHKMAGFYLTVTVWPVIGGTVLTVFVYAQAPWKVKTQRAFGTRYLLTGGGKGTSLQNGGK